jgi:hypothetical protein
MEGKMERELICKYIANGTAFAAIALSLFSTFYTVQVHAQGVSFIDFPFLVRCEVSGVQRAFYLAKIDPDGVAVYVSPDKQAATVTITGKAEPAVPVLGEGDCAGRTLEQLRSAGQAYYLRQ